jgi:hypothetical protein
LEGRIIRPKYGQIIQPAGISGPEWNLWAKNPPRILGDAALSP